MKRKIFFLLDRLQIKRSERRIITALTISAMILSSILLLHSPEPNYSEESYAELEQLFHERSQAQEQEVEAIMARYTPDENPERRDEKNMQQIELIPVQSDTTEPEDEASTQININTAGADKLQDLPGVGPAYSQRIIEWREEHGEFTEKKQLLEIRGIGPARFAQIKDLIEL